MTLPDVRKRHIFPAGRRTLHPVHRCSAVVRSGYLVVVSDQVGSHADRSAEPDFEAQVSLAFDNLAALPKAAGCSFDDVVDVTTFLTDPAISIGTVKAVCEGWLCGPPYPNSTAVGVIWLAGFEFGV